jgi:hypothetical protein
LVQLSTSIRLYTAQKISGKKKIGHKGELYWEERWDIIGKFVPPLPLPPAIPPRGKSCASN